MTPAAPTEPLSPRYRSLAAVLAAGLASLTMLVPAILEPDGFGVDGQLPFAWED